jgi:hypothetical protein
LGLQLERALELPFIDQPPSQQPLAKARRRLLGRHTCLHRG